MPRVGGVGPHPQGMSTEGEELSPPWSRQPSPAGMQLFFSGWGFLFCAGLCSWEEMNLPSSTIQISLKAVAAASPGHTAPFGR